MTERTPIEIIEEAITVTDLKKYPYLRQSVNVLKKALKELKEKARD